MFIDASVIVAILGREPGHEELEKRLAEVNGPFFVSPLVKSESVGRACPAEIGGSSGEKEDLRRSS